MRNPYKIIFIVFSALFSCQLVYAQTSLRVVDTNGNALSNIVVELYSVKQLDTNSTNADMADITGTKAQLLKKSNKKAVIEQRDQQFVPHISVHAVNTQITFPNADNVQHHVYSFSPAKTFEVTLREEFTSDPISFDKAGVVELGCNIHDWMLAYVYISDANWFGQTGNNGEAELNVNPGEYELRLWHPRLKEADIVRSQKIVVEASQQRLSVSLTEALLPSLTGYDTVEAVDAY